MANPVVHFEIPAANLPRARRFYASAFGWKVQATPGEDYSLVGTTPSAHGRPKSPGAINGAIFKRQTFAKNPIITIMVPEIGAALRKVKRGGGKVLQTKEPVGDFGFAAYFKDTEGNVVGLFQLAR